MGSKNNDAHIAYFVENENNLSTKQRLLNALEALGGLGRFVKPGNNVLLKPNFVAPFKKAVTSFEIVEVLVEKIKELGAVPIIGESSGYEFNTEMTFDFLGVYDLAKQLDVEVVNLDSRPYIFVKVKEGLVKEVFVSKVALDSDVIINRPRLKKHSQTDVTAGIKIFSA